MLNVIKKINSTKADSKRIICMTVIIALIMSLAPLSISTVFAESEEPEPEPEPEKQYTIILNGMGVSVSPTTLTVTSGSAYGNLPQLKKDNYQFKGWFTHPDNGIEITSGAIVTEPVPEILYARWEGKEFKVTLDPCRAVIDQKQYTVKYGDDYSFLPEPNRKGLVFLGWYTKKSGGKIVKYNDTITLKNDIKLYAKWAPTWYLQTDKKWRKKWYRVRRESSTIGSAGCGPTTMAMVVASLKNTKVTPVTACKWSKKKKYKAYLSGTKDGFFKAYGKKNGIKVKQLYYSDLRYTKKKRAKKYHNKAKSAVKKGNWVIVLAGRGNWTRGSGHFILWYKTEGDKALIRDSNSKVSKRAKAKVSTLQKQAKRYWVVTVPNSKKVN